MTPASHRSSPAAHLATLRRRSSRASRRLMRNRIPGVRRIAVLRANALGDFILTLPALDALAAAYPEAEIVLLGRSWHRELLVGRPGPVHRVIEIPDGAIGDEAIVMSDTERRAIRDEFLAHLGRERWDIAVQ